ncbi:hypothetical protein [Bifidobacterium pseudolongum]|uniref:hypothetical protein n=1 Tax=Bifidobacterium pseudolongum TaxID=1694 RepID=UPI00102204A1|nr:hypothetical protein [Bifidobacterium pseudolongum]
MITPFNPGGPQCTVRLFSLRPRTMQTAFHAGFRKSDKIGVKKPDTTGYEYQNGGIPTIKIFLGNFL